MKKQNITMLMELEKFISLIEQKNKDASLIAALKNGKEKEKKFGSLKDLENEMGEKAYEKIIKNVTL